MKNENLFRISKSKPIVVGTGLVALDFIINGNKKTEPHLRAGGSCGNVLTILSYLGWKSYPIARFKKDNAAKIIIEDIRKWGVDTSLITQNCKGSTPIIIERIKKSRKGEPIHVFSLKCPNCGSFLPSYRPVLAKDMTTMVDKMPNPHVYYFDRVARSSIEIAKASKKNGALIFFEPSSIKNQKQFLECLSLSDIVKYSYGNMKNAQEILEEVDIPMRIETLGAEGLRFCLGKFKSKESRWKSMCAYLVDQFKDSAGAGDWCSAGIIHFLGAGGVESFNNADKSEIDKALNFSQMLAAMNCQFEGARGIMYALSKNNFQSIIRNMWERGGLPSIEEKESDEVINKIICYCPKCRKRLKQK